MTKAAKAAKEMTYQDHEKAIRDANAKLIATFQAAQKAGHSPIITLQTGGGNAHFGIGLIPFGATREAIEAQTQAALKVLDGQP